MKSAPRGYFHGLHVVLFQILHVRHVVANGSNLVDEQNHREHGEEEREEDLRAQKYQRNDLVVKEGKTNV